ncbi:MAG: helix-turn-helix transcriptional regulator [Muribaculaceae bacterium]|nr:helix-turn-helix transcriptional regulator [Muribaculaceae bacterium]MBQ7851289.1 helix-turn-helix transcriptional regulator [Muribaculaceae bacterium]MBQ9072904.1 helix-turn-helix transcriptional regulator [Muribaculaceae bacterium]
MPDFKKIHIGERIAEKLRDKKMTYAEFARCINVDRSTVYNILRSKSIDIERLLLISKVLDYNFIEEVYLKAQPTQRTIEIVIPESKFSEIDNIQSMKIIIASGGEDCVQNG